MTSPHHAVGVHPVIGVDAGTATLREADHLIHELLGRLALGEGVFACTHLHRSDERRGTAISLAVPDPDALWQELPAALPEILTGLRIAIGFGWTTLVAAEMVAATAGLGQMVLNASSFLRTDIVVMGILIIGAIAWLFDLAMRWVERRVVPWKGRS